MAQNSKNLQRALPAHVVGRFGVCATKGAERTLRERWGPISRPLLGPRSSGFEHMKRFCMFKDLSVQP
eukprot:11389478-Alexandrium_andersonii.AAC.1